MDVAIGFDTSCYTTSVAVVDVLGNVITSQRKLLPVESGQRGLRQSEAVFAHVRQMPDLMALVGKTLTGFNVCAVAASAKPRDSAESYMPVFLVGLGHAQTLANVLGVSCEQVTHQRGHIAAGEIGNPAMDERFFALHLSGGTTELLDVTQKGIAVLGSSLDLHAGQFVDRIGVALGLGFPAGPQLEQLALTARETVASALPASLANGDLDCHFSGAETKCRQWIASGALPPASIAAEVFDLLARTVARMLYAAAKQTGVSQALLVGGVTSSSLLRALIPKRLGKLGSTLDIRFGKPEYSADNAAGVALLGMRRYLATREA